VQTCSAGGEWGRVIACTTGVANASPLCASGGVCGFDCDAGYSQCLAACVNEQSDDKHCGGCGGAYACAAGKKCVGGACTPPTPPSCQSSGAGRTNCGAASEDCCTSPQVAGGTFYRTYANDGSGPTGQADPATVSDFRLDKYDVTVGRFRQFVNAVLPPDLDG
jgi:sulfatase modifying factor 1